MRVTQRTYAGHCPLPHTAFSEFASMADFLATVLAKVAVLLVERLVVHLSQVVASSLSGGIEAA